MNFTVDLPSIAIIATAIASIYAAYTANKSKAAVQEVHQLVNSRMTELLELTRTAARAEGIKSEKDFPSPHSSELIVDGKAVVEAPVVVIAPRQ